MKKCCLCSTPVDREDAPVLGIGGAGNPRVLCSDCESHLDNAMSGRDYESIKNSINIISDRLSKNDPDRYTFDLASSLILDASKRAKAIKEGTYDFSAEAENDDGFDEIPEELLESEEDRELDRMEEEKSKKFDKVYNIVLIILLVLAAGHLVYTVVTSFLQ